MLIKRLFCLFLFLSAFSSLHAQTVVQYEELRVAKIDLLPENLPVDLSFDARAVCSRMQTKVGNFFSQVEFDRDLKSLAEEYERIEPAFQIINDQLYITIRLWIKPVIRTITFCGSDRFSLKKLNKELGIQPGSTFNREEFVQGFNKLKMLYVRKGYFEAVLDFEVIPTEACNEVDITIRIDEGRAGRIKKIVFCGFSSREKDDILDLIVTKKYNLLLSWISGTGVYHPEMIEHDRLVILNYLQNQGYADAYVSICVEETCEKDKIIVQISADKGTLYGVGNVSVCGNTLFSNGDIFDELLFWSGEIFSPERIRDSVEAIRDLYGSLGYIDAIVDVELSLRQDCPIYDVSFTIEEGEQYCVGMVRVFGNRSTQARVILNENLLCPGDIFDIRRLQGTEERLVNTGYFKTVNVYAVKSPDEEYEDSHYRDVYIEVEEADTGNIGIFAGFSTIDRLFGGIELTEQNFNILGLPAVLSKGPRALRGGGEYFHAKANIGDKQTSYIAQWTKPYFLDTDWIVGVDVEKSNNRALSSGYEIKNYGGSVHATYIINEFIKHDFYYRARHTNVSVEDSDNVLLVEEARNSGFISAVGTAFIYDSTNSPRRPNCGLRSRAIYELAGLGGNFQFMKFGYFNTYYYPVSKKGTFKFRADFQFIHTYGHTTPSDLPLGERLYLGGETTVRGYRPFSIGPKFGNNEPRGGVSSYLLSEEYQHNLLKNPCLDAFCFVDAGYVSLSEFTVGRQVASAGFGIRVELMRNVPMTFGLGWPIHPFEKRARGDGTYQRINNAQRFFFSMGACF